MGQEEATENQRHLPMRNREGWLTQPGSQGLGLEGQEA